MPYSILVYESQDGRWSARAEGETYGCYVLGCDSQADAALCALLRLDDDTYRERCLRISKSEAARVGGLYRVRDGEEASDG